MQVFTGRPAGQIIRYFPDLGFPHAAHQKIRAAFRQDRGQQLIFPVVVMGKAAQARFNAANDDRDIRP